MRSAEAKTYVYSYVSILHLVKVRIVCGGELEALLQTLVFQHGGQQMVGHLHVTPKEAVSVADGGVQKARQALRSLSVHSRTIRVKIFTLNQKKDTVKAPFFNSR